MMVKYDIQDQSSFTGKERDYETGYGYFGARYMDYELMAMWLSVDPMSDKYPGISPYAYCAWNPVKLVDPDGMEYGDYYNYSGEYLGSDGKKDNKVYVASGISSVTNEDGTVSTTFNNPTPRMSRPRGCSFRPTRLSRCSAACRWSGFAIQTH